MSAIAESRAGGGLRTTVFAVLWAVSGAHLLNDLVQALLPAIYPLLKASYALSFAQIGLLTLVFQSVASLLQPVVGFFTDRRPRPYSLPLGMSVSLVGLVVLAHAGSYPMLLAAAALVGLGSAVFHPEASRVTRLASGGRFGFAQSFFQVGGNFGQSLGPLAAALFVVPRGQASVAWFGLAAVLGIVLLSYVGRWYRDHLAGLRKRAAVAEASSGLSAAVVRRSIAVLLALLFSKFVYLASINTYLIFYLIDRFQLSVARAQLHLFLFLAASAVGTLVGGPIGDRVGRKYVIWFSILGVLPFTLLLPYASLAQTEFLLVAIGVVLASAFSAIIVYAQELLPGRIGLVSGLFFGGAFGMAGLAAAGLGVLADWTSIGFVYRVCSFLPMLGLLAAILPSLRERRMSA